MDYGWIIYFTALGILDVVFLLGIIFLLKCYNPPKEGRSKEEIEDSGAGAAFVFIVCGIGFIITTIIIAQRSYDIATGQIGVG